MLEGFRKAILEMSIIWIALCIPVWAMTRGQNYDLAAVLLIGFLFSPVVWALYRLGRFVVLPRY